MEEAKEADFFLDTTKLSHGGSSLTLRQILDYWYFQKVGGKVKEQPQKKFFNYLHEVSVDVLHDQLRKVVSDWFTQSRKDSIAEYLGLAPVDYDDFCRCRNDEEERKFIWNLRKKYPERKKEET